MGQSGEFDRWRDVMDWDVANWSVAIPFWKQHSARSLDGARVLELGAHRGGLSLYAAAGGAEVVCSDIESPERPASPVHLKYGVEDRITYRAINATAIDFPDATFDVVVFKSVLGGLGPWSEAQAATMAERPTEPTPISAERFSEKRPRENDSSRKPMRGNTKVR